jgi:hypothetical protein
MSELEVLSGDSEDGMFIYICLGQSTNLLVTWFVHHATRDHPVFVLYNILSLIMPV